MKYIGNLDAESIWIDQLLYLYLFDQAGSSFYIGASSSWGESPTSL